MKFKCSVDIELPRKKVVELFDNPANMAFWQDGFISYEDITGTPGEVGAQANITYKIGRKKMVLLETITLSDLPIALHGTYEGDFGKNSMNNFFDELGPSRTRWRSELEYQETKGFIMKVMMHFFPSMAKKQTQKWMDQFKKFAEEKAQSL